MVMKIFGMRPQKVEVEKGTIINFWVPSKPHNNKNLAVVFLHGFAADGILTWQFQVLSLARKYDLYVPDLVFFGKSTTERPERSPEFQAECVAAGLKKMGVKKCCVVGFSYGGFVAFKMAEMYSEMVESVVVSGSLTELVESFSGPTLHRIGGFSRWSEFLLPRTVEGVRLQFKVGTSKRIRFPTFFLRQCLQEIICVNRKKKEELLVALSKNNDSAIPKYPQKIHLIWGAKDKIFGLGIAKNLKSELGEKAELHVIEKAGHLVMLERPYVFNSVLSHVLTFLLPASCSSSSSHYCSERPEPSPKFQFQANGLKKL